MAITNAQQVRQMYKKGSEKPAMQGGGPNYLGKQPEVTVPKKWKSSPDHPDTELAYITEPEKQVLIALNMHGGLEDGKPNKGPEGIISLQGDMGSVKSDGKGGFKGDGGGPDPKLPPGVKSGASSVVTKEDEKRARREAKKFFKDKGIKTASGGNFFTNFLKARQKGLYNIVPNNPKMELQFLSNLRMTNPTKYDTLPQSLKDVLEDTDFDFAPSFKDSSKLSFDQFEDLTQFDDGAFAQYAKDRGSPGLSVSGDMSKVGLKSVRRDEFGNPVKDMFGNTLFDYAEPTGGDGDGGMSDYEKRLLELEKQNAALKNQQAAATTTTTSPIPYRLMAEGGIMNAMDDDVRQQLFLGGIAKGIKKAVKGATRAVKKIAKSKVGKAALLAAGGFYLGGGNLFGLQRAGMSGFSFGNLPGATSFSNFFKAKGLPNLAKGQIGVDKFGNAIYNRATGNSLTSLLSGMSTPGKAALGIGALSALPLLGIGTGDDEEEGEAYRGEGLDIASIRRNPYLAMQRSGSPYRLMAEGGDTEDAEPVAKKTMPLLDMGGMEKDYREEGGFVPIGRMEKADDVPARLSKNEFVFTAEAVRNAGEGDIDKGAEVMYNMMKNLESGGEVSKESQGLEGAKEMFQTSQRLEGVM